ncbi:hypothetical protein BD769DRAFT_1391560 [Suillus cothurnatus]|nr:hypothetical protein BD769DRAFT_1391560 [Suillus cothurnatus]
MSPPLEAALLFTSTSCGALSFAALANLSPKLVSRSPPMSKAKVFGRAYDRASNSEAKTKASLGSPKDSNVNQSAYVTSPDISLFPLPSSAKKLKKRRSQRQKTSVSMTLASSTSQPTISPTPTMLAILAASQSLERVNEILVRGYSERALGGGNMDGKERMSRRGIAAAASNSFCGKGTPPATSEMGMLVRGAARNTYK